MTDILPTKANELQPAGRWITEKQYAVLHGLHPQTLANWRYFDRKAGRRQAKSGYPVYRYFGTAVRYWLATSSVPVLAA
jgi:hypothetical protein